ncbi:hypothetical protein, partial [Vibrio parahaemolyticus]
QWFRLGGLRCSPLNAALAVCACGIGEISIMEARFNKLLAFSIVLVHFFAFSGLLYKSQIYGHIAVSPGEPYGLGDVIDLLFACLVVLMWCCAFVSSIVVTLLNIKSNWLASLKALLYGTVGLVGYFYVNSSVT